MAQEIWKVLLHEAKGRDAKLVEQFSVTASGIDEAKRAVREAITSRKMKPRAINVSATAAKTFVAYAEGAPK